MGRRMGKVLSGVCSLLGLLLVTGCSTNIQSQKQLSLGSEPSQIEDHVIIIMVVGPAGFPAGSLGFGTAWVLDSHGRQSLIPVYLSDKLEPGDVVRGRWIFLPGHMYNSALKLAQVP